jgi:hypothetical protein
VHQEVTNPEAELDVLQGFSYFMGLYSKALTRLEQFEALAFLTNQLELSKHELKQTISKIT